MPIRFYISDPKSLMHKIIHVQNNLCTDNEIEFNNKDNLMKSILSGVLNKDIKYWK